MATVREYFETDFGYAARVHNRLAAGNSNVELVALYDFSGYKAFLACYISDVNYCLANYIILLKALDYGKTPLIFDGKITLPSIREFPGDLQVKNPPDTIDVLARFHGDPAWVSIKEIPTSTRVFIYSESDLTEQEVVVLKAEGLKLGHNVQFRSKRHAMERSRFEVPLAFISYDSRDREIAKSIAVQLQRMRCPVWYDEFSLAVGDNLREKIEEGLKKCRKCIIILSEYFFANNGWTKKEFDSIFTREIIEEQNLVLPVWHGVTKQRVYAYSPGLLNVKGIDWNLGEEEVCRKLLLAVMQQKASNWSTPQNAPE